MGGKKVDNFSLAAVFSDNCVLQQNKPVRIFGTAESGISVRVSLTCPDGVICAEGVSIDGRWEALLPPHGAAQNCTLRAESEGRTIEFKNVAIGEVWLCGGQSNMEFELQHCTTGREHLENDAPNVRFYYTQKKVMTEPDFFESEKNTCWTVFTPESAKCWSAVGYLFGKRLSEKLGVTVGLIGCNWGGTSASIWKQPIRNAPKYESSLTSFT